MEKKAVEMYEFMQERFLWQFYSRAWDRENNMDGIFKVVEALLTGEKVERGTDNMSRYFYAEGYEVTSEMKKKLEWIEKTSTDDMKEILKLVHAKLVDVMITNSINGELNLEAY